MSNPKKITDKLKAQQITKDIGDINGRPIFL